MGSKRSGRRHFYERSGNQGEQSEIRSLGQSVARSYRSAQIEFIIHLDKPKHVSRQHTLRGHQSIARASLGGAHEHSANATLDG